MPSGAISDDVLPLESRMQLVWALAEVFDWSLDFTRDVQPGGVVWIAHRGRTILHAAYGARARFAAIGRRLPEPTPATVDGRRQAANFPLPWGKAYRYSVSHSSLNFRLGRERYHRSVCLNPSGTGTEVRSSTWG